MKIAVAMKIEFSLVSGNRFRMLLETTNKPTGPKSISSWCGPVGLWRVKRLEAVREVVRVEVGLATALNCFVFAVWPLIAFLGGLAFSHLTGVAALLTSPASLPRLRVQDVGERDERHADVMRHVIVHHGEA